MKRSVQRGVVTWRSRGRFRDLEVKGDLEVKRSVQSGAVTWRSRGRFRVGW